MYALQVLLDRSSGPEGNFLSIKSNEFDQDLFLLSWGPTVAALSYVFDKADEKSVVQRAIDGFRYNYKMCIVHEHVYIHAHTCICTCTCTCSCNCVGDEYVHSVTILYYIMYMHRKFKKVYLQRPIPNLHVRGDIAGLVQAHLYNTCICICKLL